MDFPRITIVPFVVMADDQQVWLFAALEGFDNFLRSIGKRISGPSTRVHDSPDGFAATGLECNVGFDVADVTKVFTASPLGPHLHILADVDTLTLCIPSFMVVAGDE